METKRVERRKHSSQFRAGVLQACRQADASVAAIALRNGLMSTAIEYEYSFEEAATQYGYTQRIFIPAQRASCRKGVARP